MKQFPPFVLAIFLTACAMNPEDQQAVHQRQLEKEARENFIALKAQEHPERPVVLHDDLPPPTPKPKPPMFSFLAGQPSAPAPTPTSRPKPTVEASPEPPAAPTPQPLVARKPAPTPTPAPARYAAAKPKVKPTPTPAPRYAAVSKEKRPPRNLDDTVYYWQVQAPSSQLQRTPRELAAEEKYARFLAKRPENLTPEERLWAHEHY